MFKLLKKLLLLFFRNTISCFYMNSANILPPPLDEEEEYNMLIGVSNKDIDSERRRRGFGPKTRRQATRRERARRVGSTRRRRS